jgi:hypothetical protein
VSGTGPRLRTLQLWAKRERMCLAILERALLLLRSEEDLPDAEVDLNRRLYFLLLIASRELYPTETVPPIAECNNQPDADDESRAAREQKRPDFQWAYLDRYEPDAERSSKQFVVECKRLGKPCRADWVFNVNYVRHGISRFRDQKWAYAKRFRSGAMVGYCQSMEPAQVLKEVNEEVRRNTLPDLAPNGAPVSDSQRLEHEFERPFEVSPFHLHHLWIYLRPPESGDK